MNKPLTRRRFIGISAAVAGIAALPFGLPARNPDGGGKLPQATEWQGIALGAGAHLRLYHPDSRFARNLIGKAVAEVERLEKIFSLYRNDSLLAELNQTGRLNNPPAEMLAVLSISRHIHRLTQGAFDPTVQPLWQAYADHFARKPGSPDMPGHAVSRALSRVGFEHIAFDNRAIRFGKPGMALSFNGIAQGYITDRITDMLRDAGLEQALVDMGEIRALETQHRHIWQAGIRHPEQEHTLLATLPLQNQALATSSGYATPFDEACRFTHLFHPRSGRNQPRCKSISVMAENAATADALSTAFAVSDIQLIRQVIAQHKNWKVWMLPLQGSMEQFG